MNDIKRIGDVLCQIVSDRNLVHGITKIVEHFVLGNIDQLQVALLGVAAAIVIALLGFTCRFDVLGFRVI